VPRFVKSVLIDAPPEDVFAFHERDDALELLTPAFPPVRVISKTGGIEKGACVELRVVLFHWIAMHVEYRKNRLFVDEQISGPFARWTHRHEFEPLGGSQTILTDTIEYALPGGPLINSLFGWTLIPGLMSLFKHRHRVTREYCEKRL
jgi:ligand-binding SRPBCC domain-containing protein